MTLLLWLACTSEPVVPAAAPPLVLTTAELVAQLEDPETAPTALDELVLRGEPEPLAQLARAGGDQAARGHAIVGLVRLETGASVLREVQLDEANPELVRLWAAAGRVRLADAAELAELEGLLRQWPELERPIELRRRQLGGAS